MTGRDEQLQSLEKFYESEANNLTILYGRRGIGKTALLREFARNHQSVYYEAVPSDKLGMLKSFATVVSEQIHKKSEPTGYMGIMTDIAECASDKVLIIIEEFQNMVRIDPFFMDSVIAMVRQIITDKKVMIVLTGSSIAWVENSMVSAVGSAAHSINAFIKLKEFNFSDVVSMFPECDARSALYIYAITGGIPEYLDGFRSDKSIKENVCNIFLKDNAVFRNSMLYYLKDEFRETGVYNTLLECLASGLNKLNEIHKSTGYGRDKISVYLNNLIEREIAEKIFSYDKGPEHNVRKGLYRIKDGFAGFWYGLVHPKLPLLGACNPSDFYDKYIEPGLDEFCTEAYIRIAMEFLHIMNEAGKLYAGVEYRGRWYGKAGDVHIIYDNNNGDAVIGQVYTCSSNVGMAEYEKLNSDAALAGLNVKEIYMFALNGYDDAIRNCGYSGLMTINIEDL